VHYLARTFPEQAWINVQNACSHDRIGSSQGGAKRRRERRMRFRKKPGEIEAWQIGSFEPRPSWLEKARTAGLVYGNCMDYVEIKTLEGRMRGERGDWVIHGVMGELYPCKPEIFEILYEPAT
jgi:hypothetical protein